MEAELVNIINQTASGEHRPRYLLVLADSKDWEYIANGFLLGYPGIPVQFWKISNNISYTFCSTNYPIIIENLQRIFGHNRFFISAIL